MAEEAAKILAQLKKIPGWERFPLPEVVYKELGVPKPELYDGIFDYLKDAAKTIFAGGEGSAEVETRGPAEGGVRVVPEAPKVEIQMLEQKSGDEKSE